MPPERSGDSYADWSGVRPVHPESDVRLSGADADARSSGYFEDESPTAPRAPRAQLDTLTDDDRLEEARAASERPSLGMEATARASLPDREIEWDPGDSDEEDG
jgi:hypothetical protein